MQFIYPYYNATIKLAKQFDGSWGGSSSNWRIKTPLLLSIGISIMIIWAKLPMCIRWSYHPKAIIGVTVVDEEGSALGVE